MEDRVGMNDTALADDERVVADDVELIDALADMQQDSPDAFAEIARQVTGMHRRLSMSKPRQRKSA